MLSVFFSTAIRRRAFLLVLFAGSVTLPGASPSPASDMSPQGAVLATTRDTADENLAEHRTHAQASADQYSWDDSSIDWYYNATGGPPGSEGWTGLITNAAGAWNAAGTAAPALGSGAPGDGGTEACDLKPDGLNTVGWAPLGESYLARTCIIYGERRADGTLTVAEFDIQVNWHPDDPTFVPWTAGEDALAFDFETVLLHELGHALGLDHAGGCPGAVMCATIIMGQPQRTPATADIEALAAVYPSTSAGEDTVTLSRGWSLVTWTGGAMQARDLVENAEGDVTAVFAFDSATRQWLRFAANAPEYVNTLRELRPGQAYWLVTANGATLHLSQD